MIARNNLPDFVHGISEVHGIGALSRLLLTNVAVFIMMKQSHSFHHHDEFHSSRNARMHIEVRNLQLISAVAEEGGLTRAAEKLHLTQSALSHQLRDMVDRLGTRLFLRLGKRMVLTPSGERLLRSAHAVQTELDQAQADIVRMVKGESGTLRISTQCYTCYHWLPPLLKTFHKTFPEVDVKIVLQATHNPLEAMLEGKLDLALVSRGMSPHPRLQYVPVFEDELMVIMSRDHPFANKPYIEAADFRNEHLLVYELPDDDITILREVLKPAGVSPRKMSRVALTEAIIELVKAGLGVGVMAQWAVMPELKARKLAARPLTRRGFRRQWCAAVPVDLPVPAYTRQFIDLMKSRALPAVESPGKRRDRGKKVTQRKVA